LADANSLPPDQRDVLQAFLEEGVKFLVVGGFAFAAHAFIRATKDIDLWIEPSPENAGRVWRALTTFGATLLDHGLTQSDLESADLIYQLGHAPVRVDVMTDIGLPFQEAWERRIEVDLAGLMMPILGLDDLIASKQIADRDQDRVDLKSLERVRARRDQQN